MNMQEFWDQQAKSGKWSSHYEGDANLGTYNFYTRRTAVKRMLEGDGDYGRILDVGCGTGDYVEIAERHNGAFFGLDYAPGMIERATEEHPTHNKRDLFAVGSGDKLPYRDDQFDLVLGMGFIEYFPDQTGPVAEIKRVLKPGGTLVLQSFKWELFGYLTIKVHDPIRAAITRRPARGGDLPDTWFDRRQGKRELDDLLGDFGFERTDHVFNNFLILPPFLRQRFPKTYIRMSEAMARTTPNLWRAFAANYIGKYVLNGAG